MIELTGRTRFRVGKEGFIFKKTVLILEVEEAETCRTWKDELTHTERDEAIVSWRDATMSDISTSRETGSNTR